MKYIRRETREILQAMPRWFKTCDFVNDYCNLLNHHEKTAQRELRYLVKLGIVKKQSTLGYYENRYNETIKAGFKY